MGRGDGVEVRATSIRLFFVHEGRRCKETLTLNGKPLKPTAPNIAHAHRVAEAIRKRLDNGTFSMAEFFPDSPRAALGAPRTFGQLADDWLKSKTGLEAATVDQYRNAAAMWKRILGASTPIETLTHQKLAATLGEHPWSSAKAFNNYMIPLRGIFAFEYRGEKALLNPLADIRNRRTVKKLPDPLTAAERDRILEDMLRHYDVRVWAYYQFAFFTGMRPEEIIALQWGDIDRAAGTVRVQRVRTFKGSERDGTKTHAQRDVDLVSGALEALAAMEPLTKMKRADIFENPVTGRPWHDERSQRDHYWKPSLRRLGIRERRSYTTRHTFCTVALMNRVQPAYIAAQAGHSLKMLLDVYARWIPGADGGAEREALEAAMGRRTCEDSEARKRLRIAPGL